jgi:probable HAF family extracellular repeat protein
MLWKRRTSTRQRPWPRFSVWRRCAGVWVIVSMAAPSAAAAAGPVPIDIGSAGSARGINNNGQIVGGRQFEGGPAWLWKQGAGLTWLGAASSALAINDSAMVVGNKSVDVGGPFVWTPASGLVELATLGGERYRWTWASDVNEHNQVVGKARDRLMTSPTDRAILWTPEGWMVDLGSLPGKGTAMAAAINDGGQVAGTSGEQGSYSYAGHAFLWTQAGGMIDLGTLPGGDYSQAKAIDNSGQVVGDSGTFFGAGVPVHAFLWTQAGGMVDLGTLPGATNSSAYGINDRGQVVGVSGGRPFLWSQATGMTELGMLPGDTEGAAYAINDQGQVVGTSRNSARSHALLWFGDTTRPSAQLRPVRGQNLTGVLRRGLRVELTLSEPATGEITVSLGSSKGTIAHKTVSFAGAGTTTVTLQLDHTARTRAARARLRKVSKATLKVRSAARDLAGNSDVTTTKLILK